MTYAYTERRLRELGLTWGPYRISYYKQNRDIIRAGEQPASPVRFVEEKYGRMTCDDSAYWRAFHRNATKAIVASMCVAEKFSSLYARDLVERAVVLADELVRQLKAKDTETA